MDGAETFVGEVERLLPPKTGCASGCSAFGWPARPRFEELLPGSSSLLARRPRERPVLDGPVHGPELHERGIEQVGQLGELVVASDADRMRPLPSTDGLERLLNPVDRAAIAMGEVIAHYEDQERLPEGEAGDHDLQQDAVM